MFIRLSVAVILGGAMGNLIDRIFYGYFYHVQSGGLNILRKEQLTFGYLQEIGETVKSAGEECHS